MFLLKLSKVKRNGGVCELDLSPINMTSSCFILSGEEGGFGLILFLVKTKVDGKGYLEVAFRAYSKSL